MKETTTPHHFNPVDDFRVTVSENLPDTPQVWRVLLDEQFKAKLKIIKKDDETKRPVLLPNTEFKVFDVTNDCYVEQVTTYPFPVKHTSYFTDEDGYLILAHALPLGEYRIEEVNAPDGYTINTETKEEGTSADTETVEEDSIMITSDFNLLDVDFYLEYRVSDPVKYLYESSDPEGILVNLAKSAIRSTVSDYTVDAVMTTDKAKVQTDIKAQLSKSLEENDIGIQVVNLSMQDAEPPTAEIMSAFKSVESAKQDAETAVTNAKKYQSEQMQAAEAEADKIVQEAEAKKAERTADAEGQVAIFNKTFEEYEKNPTITKRRMFYETMEDVLPDMKVIITDGDTEKMLPLEPFNSAMTMASDNTSEVQ